MNILQILTYMMVRKKNGVIDIIFDLLDNLYLENTLLRLIPSSSSSSCTVLPWRLTWQALCRTQGLSYQMWQFTVICKVHAATSRPRIKNKENLRVTQACGRAGRSWRPPLGGPSHHTVNTSEVISVVSNVIAAMDMSHVQYSFRHTYCLLYRVGAASIPTTITPLWAGGV